MELPAALRWNERHFYSKYVKFGPIVDAQKIWWMFYRTDNDSLSRPLRYARKTAHADKTDFIRVLAKKCSKMTVLSDFTFGGTFGGGFSDRLISAALAWKVTNTDRLFAIEIFYFFWSLGGIIEIWVATPLWVRESRRWRMEKEPDEEDNRSGSPGLIFSRSI